MGEIHAFEPEKLIVGVIYHEKEMLERALQMLTEEFGEWEDVCEEFSFSKEFSEYYDEEIGGEGLRRIYSFKRLVSADKQADIKNATNEMERILSVDGNRKVNLDPGFISHGRLMLATTKKAGFRIPLKDGIYTELTLYYGKGGWQKLPWTYRDYQSKRVQDFLCVVRKKYLEERKNSKNGNSTV